MSSGSPRRRRSWAAETNVSWISRPPARRPRRRATTDVVPEPAKGSITTLPDGEHALMKNSARPSGIAAVCPPAPRCWL